MGFLSGLFGVSDEQARSDELDRQLEELNRRQLEEGKLNQEQFDDRQTRIDAGRLYVDAELNAAAKEGFNEGVDNIRSTAGSIINFPFRLIPWQAYAIAAVVAFFYFGGGVLIRRKVTTA